MKALLQIKVLDSDTRWVKEVRFLGIPIYLRRDLDLRTDKHTKPIGFQRVGDDTPIILEEDFEAMFYGEEKN